MFIKRNWVGPLAASALLLAGMAITTAASATVISYGPGDSNKAWKEERQTFDDPANNILGVGGAGRLPIGTLVTTASGDTRLDWANRTFAEAGSAMHQTALNQIRGNLSAGTYKDVDLYEIWIDDPSAFSARTVQNTGATRVTDPQLFLFDGLGHGIIANDNQGSIAGGLTSLQARIDRDLNTNLFDNVLTSGIYLLGISRNDVDPKYTRANGAKWQIFNENNLYNMPVNAHADQNGDGIADSVVSGWGGTVGITPDDRPYIINLQGAYFSDVSLAITPVPEPGALVLLGLGLAVLTATRRREKVS